MILTTDSYKLSHFNQYPKGTTKVFSYVESRGGVYEETLFFGLQKFIKELDASFPTMEDVAFAKAFADAHGEPFNEEGWKVLVALGYWPVTIKAVPEGISVPVKNVLVTIENSHDDFYWLTSFLETALLRAIWYPTTVATVSREIKKVIKHYMDETSDSPEDIAFKLHDFGARGVSSSESAGIGAMAHLVNFLGSDTIEGILYADKFYDAGVCGYSIPAAEHSTITAWTKEKEIEAYRNILTQYPTGLVAVVSDSYDIFHAVKEIWGDALRQEILHREGTLVIRPDSGDPKVILPKLMQILGERFGYHTNAKGYNVLHEKVRLIWGDGINQQSIEEILNTLALEGWSADNIAFGMGGALLQQINRDTQKFAMKASAAIINGEKVDIYKDPITDPGKKSKRGFITLTKEMKTVQIDGTSPKEELLQIVYENGKILKTFTFEEVRENAKI